MARKNTQDWIEYVALKTAEIETVESAESLASFISISTGNSKLQALQVVKNRKVVSLDLISGLTCPAADICKGHADYSTGKGKLVKNDGARYVCYAAATESRYSNVWAVRTINTAAIKRAVKLGVLSAVLDIVIPSGVILRIHSAGDFYNRAYFTQFTTWAGTRQDVSVFGYTKVLPYVTAPKSDNFRLVYSDGGIFDGQARQAGVQTAYVIQAIDDKPEHISPNNWTIGCEHATDPGDYDAILSGKSFGLMLH